MLRRHDYLVTLAVSALVSGFAATAADQPARAVASKPAAAQAQALSAAHLAKLNRLKALPQADARLTLATAAAGLAVKPMKVKKEISCGIYLYPPNPNPVAASPRLFFVNTTGQPLPGGVHIDWEVEGTPSSCCKGTGTSTQYWPPNPPTPAFLASGNLVYPPQPWTRECKAWVTMP